MGLDLRLQHKLSQQLVMTPQLQQAIKLLALSHVEMAQALERELVQNPVLEEVDGHTADALAPTAETYVGEAAEAGEKNRAAAELEAAAEAVASAAWQPPHGGGGAQDVGWEGGAQTSPSLSEHLRAQIGLTGLQASAREVAAYLVEEIDDDGYLGVHSVAACADEFGLPEADVLEVLRVVQDFDPTGVGARNLQECLLRQAESCKDTNPLVLEILRHHLKAVEARAFAKLARRLEVTPKEVVAAVRRIAHLDPHPGRAFGQIAPNYVVPDLFVTRVNDADFEVTLNEEGLPRLGIAAAYAAPRLLQMRQEVRTYVHEKVRAATWLLRSVAMRKRTMVRVMQSIIAHQRAFFQDGPAALRPMVLRDVAQDVQMHESTISRVTSNKYVHTPHGLYELKYFFNSTLQGKMGAPLASEGVRQKIMRFIDREDKNEPLSDQKIVDLLRQQDICIARRTVAKYRKMLNKRPSSSRRREF